jgi:hypothetical protein
MKVAKSRKPQTREEMIAYVREFGASEAIRRFGFEHHQRPDPGLGHGKRC